ncbi:MAG: CHAT domain-containing protein, partial [Bacteroidota bacterium]
MLDAPIFISHASADDAFVKALREKLELFKVGAWVDSRQLRVGDSLEKNIQAAITAAPHFIVILSTNAINSEWVPKEIEWAEQVQQTKENYRLIPILLPGIEPSSLSLWFQEVPLAQKVAQEANGLNEAFSAILAALDMQEANDPTYPELIQQAPIEELQLRLTRPSLETREGKHRARAEALLVYESSDPGKREEQSIPFYFEAPLGPIEKDDLSWYLERYITWPVGYYQERAKEVEHKFPEWGKMLYQEIMKEESAKEVFRSWKEDANGEARRFSIYVDSALVKGSKEEDIQKAKEGANLLLSLPWELLHDEKGYLFEGKHPVGVRRRLPNRERQAPVRLELPLRILLVSPRPEEEGVGYIDHRASSIPLVEAVENLGELIKLDILHTPTLPALRAFLQQAERENDPVEVLHFDGHGVYDPINGLGALCFEEPQDQNKIGERRNQLVDAQELGKILRDYRIPLVFLEACQTAMTEKDPTSSVAAQLLQVGVSSVIAMSHSVLVETASRFVRAFYQSLATGSRVGQALLAGQNTLYGDRYRGKLMGGRDFHLQDWFVPVLFQEEQDPQLFAKLPSGQAQENLAEQRKNSLGALPDTPEHSFVGRSRELLRLERIVDQESYVVIRGQGGAGKTTVAIELARWWVRSYRVQRAAFVSLETHTEARQVLDQLGQQLLPSYSVAEYGEDLQAAFQPIERALKDFATLIVLDNLESILPDAQGKTLAGSEDAWDQVKVLCTQLHESSPQTKLIFTSREPLPAPFDKGRNDLLLGPLGPKDAVDLLRKVMSHAGWEPPAADEGSEEELQALAKTINYHARALVLLAREIATQGVQSSHADIAQLMAGLEQKHPGDRENSLFASLELSLRRLSPEERALLSILAPSQGGNNWMVWANMLGGLEENKERVLSLVKRLEAVGLGSILNYNYIQ